MSRKVRGDTTKRVARLNIKPGAVVLVRELAPGKLGLRVINDRNVARKFRLMLRRLEPTTA